MFAGKTAEARSTAFGRMAGTIGVIAALCAGSAAAQEAAENYPSKSIRMVVPFPAGGGTDTMARLIAKGMQENWGQTVVVDNLSGAGGQIGAANVAKADPDGYTVMVSITSLIQQPPLYNNLSYDVYTDFKPVSMLAYSSDLLMVPANSPYNSLADLIADAKKNPGKVTVGTYGAGTSSHMHLGLLQLLTETKLVHVPYRGASPEVIDLVGGQIDAAFIDVTSARAQVGTDKVKTLAVTGKDRVSVAPDVPTMGELGYKGYEANGWFAVFVPAKTPDAIVDKLSKEVNRIIDTPEFTERLKALSLRAGGTTPQETMEIMKRDGESWKSIIERAKITID